MLAVVLAPLASVQGASAATEGMELAPANTEPPTVSWSENELRCSPGAWTGNPPPTFSYTWLEGTTPLALATEATYLPSFIAHDATFTCEVTAYSSAGRRSARSAPFAGPFIDTGDGPPGLPPTNTSPPAVSGVAIAGNRLSCASGNWSGYPAPTYTYTWLWNGVVVSGASEQTFTVPTTTEEQASIACEVTASNPIGRSSARSSALTIILPIIHLAPPYAAVRLCDTTISLYEADALIEMLRADLRCSDNTSLRSLRRGRHLELPFAAEQAGILVATWRLPAGKANGRDRGHSTRTLLVAAGRVNYSGRGSLVTLNARLTAAGDTLLKHATPVRLVCRVSFSPENAGPVTVTARLVLHS
jgi:hypothetical protein